MYSIDVEKRLSNFKKVRKVGEGTYGEVYEAIDLSNNNRVALKKIRIENKDEGIPITALREMCILKHLKHENIVDLYEIIQDIEKIVLIFEYVDQDLKMYLDSNKGIQNIKTVKVSFTPLLIIVVRLSNIKRSLFLSHQSYYS
jgi:serine/threonine protein kinase